MGLFTKESISAGTVFGTFDGILVTKEFFRFFDYNSSFIYVNNKSITYIVDLVNLLLTMLLIRVI